MPISLAKSNSSLQTVISTCHLISTSFTKFLATQTIILCKPSAMLPFRSHHLTLDLQAIRVVLILTERSLCMI